MDKITHRDFFDALHADSKVNSAGTAESIQFLIEFICNRLHLDFPLNDENVESALERKLKGNSLYSCNRLLHKFNYSGI